MHVADVLPLRRIYGDHTGVERILHILIDGEREKELEEMFRASRPGLVIHVGMRKYKLFFGADLADLGQTSYPRTFNLARAAEKYQSDFSCSFPP